MKYLILLLFIFYTISCSYPYIPQLRGDCVDRAVALRQSLKKQGYEARLVLGRISKDEGHCWVEYKDKDCVEWKKIDNY